MMKYVNITSSNTEDKYFYHIVDGISALLTVRKYGLCSPKALWDTVNERVDTDLLLNIINRYKERTIKFKNIQNEDEITINDVLEYLDNGRPPLTSECIFWSFISVKDMPYINNTFKGIEVKVDFATLKKYSTGNPIIVLGKKETAVSWSKLENDYEKLVGQAVTGASKDPEHKLRYRKIVHLAVPSQIIPFSHLGARKPR